MVWDDWTGIVIWLNASYPDQQIEPMTAKVWFEDLEHEATGVVAVALRRCRRMSSYRPALASILEVCREVRLERVARSTDPADATRRCGACATSPVVGWMTKVEDDATVWLPCPGCRSEQHATWAKRVRS